MYTIRNQKFEPDGKGGGTLSWEEYVQRRGFRPAWVKRSVTKEAGPAPIEVHSPLELEVK